MSRYGQPPVSDNPLSQELYRWMIDKNYNAVEAAKSLDIGSHATILKLLQYDGKGELARATMTRLAEGFGTTVTRVYQLAGYIEQNGVRDGWAAQVEAQLMTIEDPKKREAVEKVIQIIKDS